MKNIVLAITSFISCINAAPAADEIKSLPGWVGALPSRMYSGFIPSGSDTQDGVEYSMQMWYMFVEAEVPDPLSAPVVLWSNGG
jgi:serine carboxypeptidase-like clade 1